MEHPSLASMPVLRKDRESRKLLDGDEHVAYGDLNPHSAAGMAMSQMPIDECDELIRSPASFATSQRSSDHPRISEQARRTRGWIPPRTAAFG